MKRLLLPLVLGCLIGTAFAFFGCTSQQSDQNAAATSNETSIPDTMLAINKGEGMYTLLDPSQPDTMGSVQLVTMSLNQPPPPPAVESVKGPATKKSAGGHALAVEPCPWPPDTMKFIFKHLRIKPRAHK